MTKKKRGRPEKDDRRIPTSFTLHPDNLEFVKAQGMTRSNYINLLLDQQRLKFDHESKCE